MDNLKITLHPAFILFAFILIYFGWAQVFLIYIVVLSIHEYSHYFVAKRLGYKLDKMLFMPYGVRLSGAGNCFDKHHEIMIALAGPLVNIFLAVVCMCIWWCWPITYSYTSEFVRSNLSLGLFNLLPIFPMDGGRFLVAGLSYKFNKTKLLKAMKIISIIGGTIFALLFVVSAFYTVNLTLFFISTFLFSSCMDGKHSVYYERIDIEKNTDKPLPVKIYAVSRDQDLYRLVKYIKGNNLTLFYMVDGGKVVKVIHESEILDYISKHNIH